MSPLEIRKESLPMRSRNGYRFLIAVGAGITLTTPIWAQTGQSTSAVAKTAQARPMTKGGKLLPPPAPVVPTVQPRSVAPSAPQVITSAPVDPSVVIVGSGGPFNFRGTGSEDFPALFSWKPDAPTDPLKFRVEASSFTGSPSIRWVRVLLGSRVLATEKNFKNNVLELDLTGTVSSGTNQIVIQGGAAPGASMKWTLQTVLNSKVASVDPDEVVLGDTVKIKGQNFSTEIKKNKVFVGKKEVPIKTAGSNELVVTIPKFFEINEHKVTVIVNGKPATGNPKLIVRGVPRLTGKSLDGVPPGYRFAIFGENFSKKLNENVVMIGDQQAPVVDGNTEQLFVICPSEGGNFWAPHAPDQIQEPLQIKLKVGKIECKNTLGIFVGNSVWQDGMRGGPDTEIVPVDVRNNF